MKPINLVPWGFGNFFGVKGHDGVVQSFEDSIRGTIDLLPFFAGSNAREGIAQAANYAVPGQMTYSLLVVPVGECWLVRGCGFSGATGAAELFRGRVIVNDATSRAYLQPTDQGMSSLADTAAAGQFGAYSTCPPFFMYPGEYLTVQCDRITTAASISVALGASVMRFKA